MERCPGQVNSAELRSIPTVWRVSVVTGGGSGTWGGCGLFWVDGVGVKGCTIYGNHGPGFHMCLDSLEAKHHKGDGG